MKGRRAKSDRPTARKLWLPESLSNELDILLLNPLTGRTAHGAFSSLVTELLRKWLAEHRKPTSKEVEK